MLPDMYNVINKARYSGIIGGPKTAPSLYQLSVKVFAKEVNCKGKPGTRIPELHHLPAVALSSVLGEMSNYPSLRKTLHRELSDPVLFLRLFTDYKADRFALENCLRKASLIGKPVLPDLARNWCKAMNEQAENTSSVLTKIMEALKLGTYLHEAGWSLQSSEVLGIASRMISQLKKDEHRTALEITCVQKILRAEGSALLNEKAETTSNILLAMVKGVSDSEVLLKVNLEMANHNFKVKKLAESHHWTRKAMELMTESTSIEYVIEILQLEALYLFNSQQNEAGSFFINQAIHRARLAFGHLHRRYADTLYTCGVSMLKNHAISDAIPILLELLDIITKLYGNYTPHVAIIQSYLAYGFYRRSQTTGRFDMAYNHIQNAIVLAKQIMPERQKVINHFIEIRAMILKGRDDVLATIEEHRVERTSNFKMFTVAEIKQKSLQIHGE